MGIMGPALFGFGMELALEREQGLIALKRALPMPKGAYLLAKMLMAAAFAILIATALALETLLLGPGSVTVAQAAGVAITCVIGTIPFCAIGLFIGARVSRRAAPAFLNLAYLPLMYLSGLFFPLPQHIHWLALFSPAFHLNPAGASHDRHAEHSRTGDQYRCSHRCRGLVHWTDGTPPLTRDVVTSQGLARAAGWSSITACRSHRSLLPETRQDARAMSPRK